MRNGLAIPEDATVELDAGTSVLLLSDLHFGDGSAMDLFMGQDEALIEFLERWRQEVDVLVFLGDIVDLPQAWSARRVRTAHPELWQYLSRLAQRERVLFVRGNHDWDVDYEALFPGSTRCDAVRIGARILAWHGHQADLMLNPDAGAKLKTYTHALVERALRRRLLPPLERYDSTANRIALAGTIEWSRIRAAKAQLYRSLGMNERAAPIEAHLHYLARSFIGDLGGIFGAVDRELLGQTFDTVVCGHSHVPGVVATPRGVYVNTGTWASGLRTYGHFTGERFRVLEVDGDVELRDEHYAHLPAETEPEDLFRWWAENRSAFFRRRR